MFHELLYRPLFNTLIFLYNTIAFGDLGFAIILLTVVIRIILYPLFAKSYRSQALVQKIQPEIKKIQKEHRGKRDQQAQALVALYKKHNINPLSSFFPIVAILIQLPILIALYRVFLNGLTIDALTDLYSFIQTPQSLNTISFGLLNLAEPSMLFVGLAASLQYVQGRLSVAAALAVPASDSETKAARKMSQRMVFIGPILTILFFYSLPAAISVYWVITSVSSIIQQLYINKTIIDRAHNDHGAHTNNRTAPL